MKLALRSGAALALAALLALGLRAYLALGAPSALDLAAPALALPASVLYAAFLLGGSFKETLEEIGSRMSLSEHVPVMAGALAILSGLFLLVFQWREIGQWLLVGLFVGGLSAYILFGLCCVPAFLVYIIYIAPLFAARGTFAPEGESGSARAAAVASRIAGSLCGCAWLSAAAAALRRGSPSAPPALAVAAALAALPPALRLARIARPALAEARRRRDEAEREEYPGEEPTPPDAEGRRSAARLVLVALAAFGAVALLASGLGLASRSLDAASARASMHATPEAAAKSAGAP